MYDTAKRRAKSPLPYTLEELREKLQQKLETRPFCPYCRVALTADNVSLDHIMPVERGGHPGLHNVEFVCKSDNKAKGDMTSAEYADLLAVLDGLGVRHRRPDYFRKKVVDALRISTAFRKGAAWRAKKAVGVK